MTRDIVAEARQLAAQGLSAKDAAPKLGLTYYRTLSLARANSIDFPVVTRRETNWDKPEGGKALRDYYTGQKKGLRWHAGGRRAE